MAKTGPSFPLCCETLPLLSLGSFQVLSCSLNLGIVWIKPYQTPLAPLNHFLFFFFLLFIYYFYFWLCWVFVSVRGLSPVVASGGHSSSRCAGLSLSRPLPLRSRGSRRSGSAIVAHGPSRSAACGILPDQGRTRVPCIGRQTLNHCATREAPNHFLLTLYIYIHMCRYTYSYTCDAYKDKLKL